MAEQIRINVQTIGAENALNQLNIIDNTGKRISANPISVKITTADDGAIARLTKFRTEAGTTTSVLEKSGKVISSTTSNFEQADRATIQYEKSLQGLNKEISALEHPTNTLLANIGKFASWYIIGNIFSSVVRSFRDAVSAMKEVDTQLTNIQKVSGKTTEEIKALGDAAYETASQYGVSASKYLEAVYTFQKAGLGDSAEKLGELATKAMLVGDTTSEVATKFIIATNAAWKLNGSYSDLSHAVDYADYINNNYAATLSDIAEGLPMVAATAAQAGMTMEETMAAIGTIVSQTAQTGNRAGYALRALIMNLAKETGDIGEGFTVTEESIKSLDAILAKYEPDAVKAAAAAGKIVDPMTAIAAMAKAAEDGLLNQAELFQLLSGIGGKLRTTQLTALVNGQEMYNEMLSKTASVAGTADAEIETMLTSWEAKTQILQNTWADFIQQTVESDSIKGVLDLSTGVLKLVGNLGNIIPVVAVLTAKTLVLAHAKKASAAASASESVALHAESVAMAAEKAGKDAATISDRKSTAEKYRNIAATKTQTAANAALAASVLSYAAIAVGVISAVKIAIDAYNRAQEEARQKAVEAAEKTQEQISALDDLEKKYIEIVDSTASEGEKNRQLAEWKKTLVEQYGFEEEALRGVNKERETGIALIEAEKQASVDAWFADSKNAKAYEEAVEKMNRGYSYSGYREFLPQFSSLFSSILEGAGFSVSKTPENELGGQTSELVSFSFAAKDAQSAVEKLEPVLAKLHEEMLKGKYLNAEEGLAIKEVETAYNAAKETIDAYNAVFAQGNQLLAERIISENKATAVTVDSKESFDNYVRVLREAANGNEDVANILEDLANKQFPQFAQANIDATNALFDTEGHLTDAGKAALNADAAFAELAKKIKNSQLAAAQTKYDSLIEGLNRTGDAALTNAAKIALFSDFLRSVGNKNAEKDAALFVHYGGDMQSYASSVLSRLIQEAESINSYTPTGGGRSTVVPSGKKSKIESAKDERAEALKNEVEAEKAQLTYLEKSGASLDKQIAQYGVIQKALHTYADYLRTINTQHKYDKEILQLQGDWWDYETKRGDLLTQQIKDRVTHLKNELSFMQERGDDTELQIAKMREIQDALHEQAEALRKIEGESENVIALSTEWWQWENKIKDAYKEIADSALDFVDKEESAAIAPLQRQLDILKAQKEQIEDAREEEEKRLAVEKARIALENAQRERTIRQYNAATGQWEWVADAKAVSDARESLAKAQQDLSDFYRDRSIKALENNIKSIQSAYDTLREAIKDFAEKVNNGTADVKDAFASLSAAIRNSGLSAAQQAAISDSASNAAARFSSNGSTVKVQSDGNAQAGLSVGTKVVTAGGTYQIVEHGTPGSTYNPKSGYSSVLVNKSKTTANTKFDSGGILHGMGGIKATTQDEMVLPPWVTASLLKAENSGAFDALLNHLGIVTAAANTIAGFGGVNARSSIGSQHNGDVFEIGGVSISEAQARSMSVYDFAQVARTLALHKGV